MKWIAVSSSVLRKIRWNGRTLALEVEFKSGNVYRYLDVPRRVFEALRDAESHGTYFNENIRDVYQYVREK
jgi:hypothetical protein